MSAPIEAVDSLESRSDDGAGAVNSDRWNQMVSMRENSVLKAQPAVAEVQGQDVDPTDTVDAASFQAAPSGMMSDARELQHDAKQDDQSGLQLETVGQKTEDQVEQRKSDAQEQVDVERSSIQYQQQRMAQAREMARELLKQQMQQGAGLSPLGSADDRKEAAAFLRAGGHNLLKEAGEDPLKIQLALSSLSDNGLEAGRANELYQSTYDMMSECGLDASVNALLGNEGYADSLQSSQAALNSSEARVTQLDQAEGAADAKISQGQDDVLAAAMLSAQADSTTACADVDLAAAEHRR